MSPSRVLLLHPRLGGRPHPRIRPPAYIEIGDPLPSTGEERSSLLGPKQLSALRTQSGIDQLTND